MYILGINIHIESSRIRCEEVDVERMIQPMRNVAVCQSKRAIYLGRYLDICLKLSVQSFIMKDAECK